MHGLDTRAVYDDAEELVSIIMARVEEWRESLGDTSITGELLDAERSWRSTVATLDAVLHSLRVQ